jgi:ABC-type glycerol-3-phosphate transport system substrate-binding protein
LIIEFYNYSKEKIKWIIFNKRGIMKMKKYLIILTVLVLGFQSYVLAQKTEITLSIGPRGFGESTTILIEGFMKENPDIKVNWLKKR